MKRVIRTKNLVCGNGIVWLTWRKSMPGSAKIGPIDDMPVWLPLSLCKQWDEIAEVVFKDFINARK